MCNDNWGIEAIDLGVSLATQLCFLLDALVIFDLWIETLAFLNLRYNVHLQCNLNKFSGICFCNKTPCANFYLNGFSWTHWATLTTKIPLNLRLQRVI